MPRPHDHERPPEHEHEHEFIVPSEARRSLSASQIEADPARLAEGWSRRFIIEGARTGEMMRLYEELGYEVCADPIRGETVSSDCADCRLVIMLDFKMIYTRRRDRQE
jgi:hypothetical protein